VTRERLEVSIFGVCVAVALVSAHGAVGSTARHAPARHTPGAAGHPTSAFREFKIPTSISRPHAIAVGPGGNLWFTEAHANDIGRITASGKIRTFRLPSGYGTPTGITDGPGGDLWFTEANDIGRITASGKISEFPIPPTEVVFSPSGPLVVSGSSPYGITTGPDGNLWFTEWLADKIGRITPSGTISQFQIPTATSHPYGITAGPDGNLWFAEEGGDKIGRITPSGTISEFQTPTANSSPYGITAGPDGNLWFTESLGNKIGRITPSGTISEFQIPTRASIPAGITTAREGNLWFTEENVDKIARVTPSGKISEFPIPTAESRPTGITATPNGNLWFTELFGNNIARVEPRLLATKCLVPKLRGKTLARAELLLAHANCKLGRVAEPPKHGHKLVVVSQSPAEQTLPSGAKVNLRLG
jgi:streptogramin lyase